MRVPAPASPSYPLATGVEALPGGLAWLPQSRTLVAADVHFAYEDVVGGALPLWSTDLIAAQLALAAARMEAREIVFLGDAIHGSRMSEGAARRVVAALAFLRERATITIVAGNHEGVTRGAETLGPAVDELARDGWLLVHGDRPKATHDRVMIGHLHPSLRLDGSVTIPVFAAAERFIVLPALTPYSGGLNVLSSGWSRAVGRWTGAARELHVVAAGEDAVYPFGFLAALREALRSAPRPRPRPFGRRLQTDRPLRNPD